MMETDAARGGMHKNTLARNQRNPQNQQKPSSQPRCVMTVNGNDSEWTRYCVYFSSSYMGG